MGINLFVNYGINASQQEGFISLPVTNGLVFHVDATQSFSYPGTGTTWFDQSGNNKNGTLNNSPTYSTDGGGSFLFNGSNRIDFGTPVVTGNSSWTFSLWVKPTATGTPFFMGATTVGQAMVTYWETGSPRVRVGTWGGDRLTPNLNHPINTWSYVTYTWNGSTLTSYTSKFESGSASGFSFNISNTAMTVGSANGVQNFSGYVSDVHVYNRVLSLSEITQNFEATKLKYPGVLDSSPTYRYWRYVVGTALVNGHHPRVSRIDLTGDGTTRLVTYTSDNCSDQGGIPDVGQVISIDLGAGNEKIFTGAQIYSVFFSSPTTNSRRASNITIQASNNNSTWTTIITGVSANYNYPANSGGGACGIFPIYQ
jgi:hypothetical protein